MPTVNNGIHGQFCWWELGTTDAKAAKQFYQGLLGWDVVDMPMGEGMAYTMLQKSGTNVGGLYSLSPEMLQQGVPPHWLAYVTVDDINVSSQKVTTLGGNVRVPPMDVMDMGKMAVVQDPEGAVFALWQSVGEGMPSLYNEVSAVCWNELCANNTKLEQDFYHGLLHWQPETRDLASGPYTTFKVQGDFVSGMMEIQKEWGNVPPNWMVYFRVENCDQSVAKAAELGGQVVVPATDVPGVGRFATIMDPQGAVFALLQPASRG